MGWAQRYLARPPENLENTKAWGKRKTSFLLAGESVTVEGINLWQEEEISKRYQDFLVPSSDDSPQLNIRVRQVESEHFAPLTDWHLPLTTDLRSHTDSLACAGLQWQGELLFDSNLKATLWTPHGSPEREGLGAFINGLENLLRVSVAFMAQQSGGLLIHSSAVVWKGKAKVFYGQSGAGKSTLAMSAAQKNYSVLSDDLNLIERGKQGYLVRQLPFSGDLGKLHYQSQPFPLSAFYRLHQSPINQARKLEGVLRYASLLACCPYVNADSFRLPRSLQILEDVLQSVPSYSLDFTRNGELWEAETAQRVFEKN